MYYEVILKNGESYCFDTEAEADAFVEGRDDWEGVYVRGEFPDCWF